MARIERKKVNDYLLDIDHPEGGSKAEFFLGVGFRSDRPQVLEHALRTVGVAGRVAETASSRYGIKYVVDGEIETPEGIEIRLRTVWIILSGEHIPRLVTAYPLSGFHP